MHPKALLDQYGLSPKQSLGQNFLSDEGLLARIVPLRDQGSAPGSRYLYGLRHL